MGSMKISDIPWQDIFSAIPQAMSAAYGVAAFANATPAAGAGADAGTPTPTPATPNAGASGATTATSAQPGTVSSHPGDPAAAARQQQVAKGAEAPAKSAWATKSDAFNAETKEFSMRGDVRTATDAFQKVGASLTERGRKDDAEEKFAREIEEKRRTRLGLSSSNISGDLQTTKTKAGIPR